jgi:hypothetical protein
VIIHSGITKELGQQRRQQITVKVAASRRQGRPHRRTWWEREFMYYPIAPAQLLAAEDHERGRTVVLVRRGAPVGRRSARGVAAAH